MEELFGLDAMSAIVLAGLVMGSVELIKRIFDRDWRIVVTILACAIVGGLAGWALGITILQGVVYGIVATGYVTLAQNIGK